MPSTAVSVYMVASISESPRVATISGFVSIVLPSGKDMARCAWFLYSDLRADPQITKDC